MEPEKFFHQFFESDLGLVSANWLIAGDIICWIGMPEKKKLSETGLEVGQLVWVNDPWTLVPWSSPTLIMS